MHNTVDARHKPRVVTALIVIFVSGNYAVFESHVTSIVSAEKTVIRRIFVPFVRNKMFDVFNRGVGTLHLYIAFIVVHSGRVVVDDCGNLAAAKKNGASSVR